MTPALRFLSAAITTASPDEASGSLFIAGVFLNGGKPRLTPSAAEFDEARGGTLTRLIECGAFDAKAGSTLFLGETEAFPNGFAVLGLGEEKDFSRKVFAECAAKAARRVRRQGHHVRHRRHFAQACRQHGRHDL